MSLIREEILKEFNITPSELNRIIATAPHRYKVFYIPKKKSGKLREIAQPAFEVKLIQNWLVSYLAEHLPIHDCAVAYRKNIGIKHNALRHTGKRFVLKMDLQDFFPSIVQNDVESHIKKYTGNIFSNEDIEDICRIVLWTPKNKASRRLCIGAPSSPLISNSIFYDIDQVIFQHCKELGVTYTRYADDLVFSTNENNILKDIESFIHKAISEAEYPKLYINKNKTIHTSKGSGINVTGVVITPEAKLSIGRNRKREIRASIHHFLNEKLDYKEIQKLNGLLSFAQDIEPEFIYRMKIKYGQDILIKIRAYLT